MDISDSDMEKSVINMELSNTTMVDSRDIAPTAQHAAVADTNGDSTTRSASPSSVQLMLDSDTTSARRRGSSMYLRDELDDCISMAATRCFGPSALEATFGQQVLSVHAVMTGTYKKDARVWLHKSRRVSSPSLPDYILMRGLAAQELCKRRASPTLKQSINSAVAKCLLELKTCKTTEAQPRPVGTVSPIPRTADLIIQNAVRGVGDAANNDTDTSCTGPNPLTNKCNFSFRQTETTRDVKTGIVEATRRIHEDQAALDGTTIATSPQAKIRRLLSESDIRTSAAQTVPKNNSVRRRVRASSVGNGDEHLMPHVPESAYYSPAELNKTDPEMLTYFQDENENPRSFSGRIARPSSPLTCEAGSETSILSAVFSDHTSSPVVIDRSSSPITSCSPRMQYIRPIEESCTTDPESSIPSVFLDALYSEYCNLQAPEGLMRSCISPVPFIDDQGSENAP